MLLSSDLGQESFGFHYQPHRVTVRIDFLGWRGEGRGAKRQISRVSFVTMIAGRKRYWMRAENMQRQGPFKAVASPLVIKFIAPGSLA